MPGHDSLAEVRSCIDAIDGDLVDLLARRQALVQRAAKFKTGQDAVRAPGRVAAVIETVRLRAAEAGLSPGVAGAIWKVMISAFTDLELAEHRALPGMRVRVRLAGPGPALTEEVWSLQLRPSTTERAEDSDAGATR